MSKDETLTNDQVQKQLPPQWQLIKNPDQIEINYQLPDYETVLKLVNQIGQLAQKADHHPDLLLHNYNQLKVSLRTHQADGITDKDLKLAQAIEQLPLVKNNQ